MKYRPRLTWHNVAMVDSLRRIPAGGATVDWLTYETGYDRSRAIVRTSLRHLMAAEVVTQTADRYRFADVLDQEQCDWLHAAAMKLDEITDSYDGQYVRIIPTAPAPSPAHQSGPVFRDFPGELDAAVEAALARRRRKVDRYDSVSL